jgi:hypothetical protein
MTAPRHEADAELERRYVAGIVVANPLRGKRGDELPHELRAPLHESGLLVCHLGDWHLFEDRPTAYQLTSLEWGWTSSGLVVRGPADRDDDEFDQKLSDRHATPLRTRPDETRARSQPSAGEPARSGP